MSGNNILFAKRIKEHKQKEIEARINIVENNLSPVVTIAGSERQVFNILQRMTALDVPGCSIAVIENGKVSWSKGYGYTKSFLGNPIITTTLFQAGSISKIITALGALMLVEQGKLDLDKPVNYYLNKWRSKGKIDWVIPENEFTKETPVILRMLLSHRAGLTVSGFPGYEEGQLLPTTIQILKGEFPAKTPPVVVDINPGTKTRYSGGGTMVVQLLIEQIAAEEGKTFAKWMKENVLDRLGMEYSTFQNSPDEYARVCGHRGDGSIVPGGAISYAESAAAGLWTTASDLAKAAIAIQNSFKAKSPSLLSHRMTLEMLRQQYHDGEYGLGPSISDTNNVLAFEHVGSGDGFAAHWYSLAREGNGVVVMTNSYSGRSLIPEIMMAVQREYNIPTSPPIKIKLGKKVVEKYDSFAGSYKIIDGFNIDILREGDNLFLQQPGANKHELLQIDPYTFADIQGRGKLIKFNIDAATNQINEISVANIDGEKSYVYAKLSQTLKKHEHIAM